MTISPKRHSFPGFTLIEIIAVLILVGIIASVAVSHIYFSADADADLTALKSYLRYTQGKAMADVTPWRIKIESSSCKIKRKGSSSSTTYDFQTSGLPTKTIFFNYRGQVGNNANNFPRNNALTLNISGASSSITIDPETGFIP